MCVFIKHVHFLPADITILTLHYTVSSMSALLPHIIEISSKAWKMIAHYVSGWTKIVKTTMKVPCHVI